MRHQGEQMFGMMPLCFATYPAIALRLPKCDEKRLKQSLSRGARFGAVERPRISSGNVMSGHLSIERRWMGLGLVTGLSFFQWRRRNGRNGVKDLAERGWLWIHLCVRSHLHRKEIKLWCCLSIYIYIYIWGVPKIGVPPVIIHFKSF